MTKDNKYSMSICINGLKVSGHCMKEEDIKSTFNNLYEVLADAIELDVVVSVVLAFRNSSEEKEKELKRTSRFYRSEYVFITDAICDCILSLGIKELMFFVEECKVDYNELERPRGLTSLQLGNKDGVILKVTSNSFDSLKFSVGNLLCKKDLDYNELFGEDVYLNIVHKEQLKFSSGCSLMVSKNEIGTHLEDSGECEDYNTVNKFLYEFNLLDYFRRRVL